MVLGGANSFHRLCRSGALAALFLCAAAATADILHLRDGSRYYGSLIQRNETSVVFRVLLEEGQGTIVRQFRASAVERVELTRGADAPPAAEAAPAEAPARAEPAREQMLREAFELLADEDYPAALRAMHQAVQGANATQAAALERLCEAHYRRPLLDVLAAARVYVATRFDRGRGFRLQQVTPQERPILSTLLAQQAHDLLGRARGGRTMGAWAQDPNAYTELTSDARALVSDAARAAALVTARLEYDATLERDQRIDVLKLRDNLARLAAHVYEMEGFTGLPPDLSWSDPADTLLELFKPASRTDAAHRPTSQPALPRTAAERAEGEP